MKINESQINKMKHALSKGRFIVSNRHKELDDLVDLSLMKRVDGPFDDFVYFITDNGVKYLDALEKEGEQ